MSTEELGPNLHAAVEDLREASSAEASGIDVRRGVLDAIASASAPRHSSRHWRLALAGGLVVALGVAWLVLRNSGGDASRAVASGSITPDQGVALPSRFVAGQRRGGHIALSRAEIELWPSSALTVSSDERFSDLQGGMTATSGRQLVLTTPVGVIVGQGVFEVETPTQGHSMTLTRNHKVAGAIALAVSVTAGWIVFRSSGGDETRIEEPGTAAIDSSGKVTSLGPRASGSLSTSGASNGADVAGSKVPPALAGAFWDDAEQRIIFALAGQVVDATSGVAVTSFDLAAAPIKSEGFGQGSVRRSFRGKADGEFVLNNLGLGTWEVEVRAEGYAPSSQTVELGDLYANPLLLFPMTAGAQVTGQVLDWKGGPVEGASVGQSECLTGKPRPECAVAKTDEDGNFVLPALPEAKAFALRAEHKKYGFAELKNLRQQAGENRHVVLTLSGIIRIVGTVTRGQSAAPVGDATVAVRGGASAQTTTTGRYEILAPLEAHPEAYVVSDPNRPKARAKIASYPERRSAREIGWVSADTHVAEVEIDFQIGMESARIVGTVSDAGGKPVADVTLDFRNTAGWKGKRDHQTFPTSARTKADGRYALEDVPVGAGYRVSISRDDQPRTVLGFVSVAKEETVVANFMIGTGTIRGRFVDASGAPFFASSRGCMRLGATSMANVHHLPTCYPDGRFEFAKLPAGTYRLENRLPQQSSPLEITATEVEVKPGGVSADVAVTVAGQPSQQWKLRVLNGEGRFVAGAYVRWRQGKTMFTSNLDVGSDGVATLSLSKSYDVINIDAAGHESVELKLAARDPANIIEVRMERKSDP